MAICDTLLQYIAINYNTSDRYLTCDTYCTLTNSDIDVQYLYETPIEYWKSNISFSLKL